MRNLVGRELGLVVLDNKAEKGGIPIIWRPPFFRFCQKVKGVEKVSKLVVTNSVNVT